MRLLGILSLLVAASLAGCSGGGGSDATVPDQDAEGRYVVNMQGQRFVPSNAEVPAGSTVVWKYVSGGAHDVSAEDGSFDSDVELGRKITSGEYEHTFDEEGTFEYVCQVHEAQGMKGTITVVANATT